MSGHFWEMSYFLKIRTCEKLFNVDPFFVFYTDSVTFGPRFIPETVFYTQSIVRSPQSVFCADGL